MEYAKIATKAFVKVCTCSSVYFRFFFFPEDISRAGLREYEQNKGLLLT